MARFSREMAWAFRRAYLMKIDLELEGNPWKVMSTTISSGLHDRFSHPGVEILQGY